MTALNLLERWCSIVACIQTEMLRMLFSWIGTQDHDAIQGDTEQAYIVTIGPINDEGQGNPGLIGEETAFGTALPAISGMSSSCGFAERGQSSSRHLLLAIPTRSLVPHCTLPVRLARAL